MQTYVRTWKRCRTHICIHNFVPEIPPASISLTNLNLYTKKYVLPFSCFVHESSNALVTFKKQFLIISSDESCSGSISLTVFKLLLVLSSSNYSYVSDKLLSAPHHMCCPCECLVAFAQCYDYLPHFAIFDHLRFMWFVNYK